MAMLDSLRASLYTEFKPEVKTEAELVIDDSIINPPSNYIPVATKKVTQIRPTIKTQPHDSQPEILQEVERDNRMIQYMDLPSNGPLVKPVPEVDDFVFTIKHPLFPWVKGKVSQFTIFLHKNIFQIKILFKLKFAGCRDYFQKTYAIQGQVTPEKIRWSGKNINWQTNGFQLSQSSYNPSWHKSGCYLPRPQLK